MKPIAYFESVWARCDELTAMHAYLANQLTPALRPDELLRAEWVARVSALDLYVHELVAQGMMEIFEGRRKPSTAFLRFQLSNEVLLRIRATTQSEVASSAYDFEVRSRLGLSTYQEPEKIADGIRLISDISLWNSIVTKLGSTPASMDKDAKVTKRGLSLIVERRNKIAHEGDLQPSVPRTPWPIAQADLQYVASFIRRIVDAIDQIV